MKRLLYLVHRNPAPPNRGHRIRSFHWLDYLARRAEVDVAFLADEPVDEALKITLRGRCRRFAFVPHWGRGRYLQGLASLALGRTATEGLFRSRALRHLVRKWAGDTPYDAVIVYCSSMVPYVSAADLWQSRIVVDLVDVDSQKWFDYAACARGPLRALFRLEGRRLRRLEASLPQRAGAVCLVSEAEREVFQRFCPAENVLAVGNGVDLELFSPQARLPDVLMPRPPESEGPTCVFIGALDYRANVDGVCWFVQQVWPAVRQRFPEAVFRLVGARAGGAITAVARRPGVELVGDVPDVRPYLASATAAVIPLRVARGIQNKVLEAMAMARPVVASSEALEGIDAEPGRDVCRADTPDEWIEQIARVFGNAAYASCLGQAARQTIETQYAWPVRLAPLERLLELQPEPA